MVVLFLCTITPEAELESIAPTVMNCGVKVGVHQGSVLSPLLFVIVLEALSREFRTGTPRRELLYADDLVISAETEEGHKMKLNKWKTEMEAKGLKVNMGKIKIMVSGVNLQTLKDSGKYPVFAEKVLAVTPSTVLDAHIGYTRNVVV